MPKSGIQHYRILRACSPFSLADLEAFCATLRAHGFDGETVLDGTTAYQTELAVKINEPLLTPTQLRSVT